MESTMNAFLKYQIEAEKEGTAMLEERDGIKGEVKEGKQAAWATWMWCKYQLGQMLQQNIVNYRMIENSFPDVN